MSDLTLANEIARQIGTEAFLLMGRPVPMGDANSLSFRIKGSTKWNHVKVILAPDDTYTVRFIKTRKMTMTKHDVTGVYVDKLHDVIEENTGVYLSLKPRVS